MRKLLSHLLKKFRGKEPQRAGIWFPPQRVLDRASPYSRKEVPGIHPGEKPALEPGVVELPPGVREPASALVISESGAGQPHRSALSKVEEEERLIKEAAERWEPKDLEGLKTPEELKRLAEEAAITDEVRHLLWQHKKWHEEAEDLHGRLQNDYLVQKKFRERGDDFHADKMQQEIKEREGLVLSLGLLMREYQDKIEKMAGRQ